MQEPLSFANLPGLPLSGSALAELRRLEHGYRELATEHGFTEVSLPLAAPAARFRNVLTGGDLLARGPRFTDPSGREWALRSDMTAFAVQFVLEHASELAAGPVRLAYAGKVFSYEKVSGREHAGARHGPLSSGVGADTALESWEFGAEIMGEGELTADLEILALAEAAASRFGLGRLTLVVGDARIARALQDALEDAVPAGARARMAAKLAEAFAHGDRSLFDEIFAAHPPLASAFREAVARSPMDAFVAAVRAAHPHLDVVVDPWSRRTHGFYSGITFEILARDECGKLVWAGGGGRYDSYFENFGRAVPAVGFMLKDPSALLEAGSARRGASPLVRIALPKGRLLPVALDALARVGVEPSVSPEGTRKLVLPSRCGAYEFLLVKNTDVPRYLDRGMADFAVVGSDVLDEEESGAVRPVTFAFGRCRVCLAGKPGLREGLRTLRRPRVATKYLRLAEEALRVRGVACDFVPLQGSVELASVIDMADAIVDLVETGSTLRENGLEIYEVLGETRVHLACSRGFHYRDAGLVEHWRAVWTTAGLVSGGTNGTDGTDGTGGAGAIDRKGRT